MAIKTDSLVAYNAAAPRSRGWKMRRPGEFQVLNEDGTDWDETATVAARDRGCVVIHSYQSSASLSTRWIQPRVKFDPS